MDIRKVCDSIYYGNLTKTEKLAILEHFISSIEDQFFEWKPEGDDKALIEQGRKFYKMCESSRLL